MKQIINKTKQMASYLLSNTNDISHHINLNMKTQQELLEQEKQLDIELTRITTQISMQETDIFTQQKELNFKKNTLIEQLSTIQQSKENEKNRAISSDKKKFSSVIAGFQTEVQEFERNIQLLKEKQKADYAQTELLQSDSAVVQAEVAALKQRKQLITQELEQQKSVKEAQINRQLEEICIIRQGKEMKAQQLRERKQQLEEQLRRQQAQQLAGSVVSTIYQGNQDATSAKVESTPSILNGTSVGQNFVSPVTAGFNFGELKPKEGAKTALVSSNFADSKISPPPNREHGSGELPPAPTMKQGIVLKGAPSFDNLDDKMYSESLNTKSIHEVLQKEDFHQAGIETGPANPQNLLKRSPQKSEKELVQAPACVEVQKMEFTFGQTAEVKQEAGEKEKMSEPALQQTGGFEASGHKTEINQELKTEERGLKFGEAETGALNELKEVVESKSGKTESIEQKLDPVEDPKCEEKLQEVQEMIAVVKPEKQQVLDEADAKLQKEVIFDLQKYEISKFKEFVGAQSMDDAKQLAEKLRDLDSMNLSTIVQQLTQDQLTLLQGLLIDFKVVEDQVLSLDSQKTNPLLLEWQAFVRSFEHESQENNQAEAIIVKENVVQLKEESEKDLKWAADLPGKTEAKPNTLDVQEDKMRQQAESGDLGLAEKLESIQDPNLRLLSMALDQSQDLESAAFQVLQEFQEAKHDEKAVEKLQPSLAAPLQPILYESIVSVDEPRKFQIAVSPLVKMHVTVASQLAEEDLDPNPEDIQNQANKAEHGVKSKGQKFGFDADNMMPSPTSSVQKLTKQKEQKSRKFGFVTNESAEVVKEFKPIKSAEYQRPEYLARCGSTRTILCPQVASRANSAIPQQLDNDSDMKLKMSALFPEMTSQVNQMAKTGIPKPVKHPWMSGTAIVSQVVKQQANKSSISFSVGAGASLHTSKQNSILDELK